MEFVFIEVTPKIVAEAFYGEVENEVRQINRIEYVFRNDSNTEICMEMIKFIGRISILTLLRTVLRTVKSR